MHRPHSERRLRRSDHGAITNEWMLVIAITTMLALIFGPRVIRAVDKQSKCVETAISTGTQRSCVRR
jgi:hypothetical protein